MEAGKLSSDELMSSSTPSSSPKAAAQDAPRPTYLAMILEAVLALGDRRGSSRQSIAKYIAYQYGLDVKKSTRRVNQALKAALEKGLLRQVSGSGVVGSFKLGHMDMSVATVTRKLLGMPSPQKTGKSTKKQPAAKAKAKGVAAKAAAKDAAKAAAKKGGAMAAKAKAAAKKAAGKKSSSKKAAAGMSTSKKAAARMSTSKKAAAGMSTSKKAAAGMSTSKKAAAGMSTSKKAASKTAAKKAGQKAQEKKAAKESPARKAKGVAKKPIPKKAKKP